MTEVFKDLCIVMREELSAFAFLSQDDLKKASDFFQCKSFSSGEILWEEGDPCAYVAFIVSGRVQVKKKTKLKGNKVILGIYSKGAYVGVLCILDGSPRAVTAEAIEDSSVVVISRENFDKLSMKHPDISNALMKGMLMGVSKRLKNSFTRLVAVF
jgi:CRP-like cAMP-binding protein